MIDNRRHVIVQLVLGNVPDRLEVVRQRPANEIGSSPSYDMLARRFCKKLASFAAFTTHATAANPLPKRVSCNCGQHV